MLISRITKSAAAIGALALLSSTAYAGSCGNNSTYCNSSSHSQGSSYAARTSISVPPIQNYSSVASSSYAAATYGSGSISSAYTEPGSSFSTSSISNYSVAGLGANERLCPTACGDKIGVHGAGGAKVLGCYKVCKPAVVNNYVRVVRPIIYVRYPVHVAVPAACPVRVTTHYSRYGGWSQACGW